MMMMVMVIMMKMMTMTKRQKASQGPREVLSCMLELSGFDQQSRYFY